MTHHVWFLVALLGSLAWPASASAYSSPGLFAAPTHEGGGGGRHFTGSRRDGLGCDACHGGGDTLEFELSGLPRESWLPGSTYTIDVAWSPTIDHAGVLAEFCDELGHAVGTITLPPEDQLTTPERCSSGLPAAEVLELDDERRAIAVGDCGAHRMRVQWRAPEDPAIERISVHIAGVRGDNSGDATGDGVLMFSEGIDRVDLVTGGCAVAPAPSEDRNWLLGLLIALSLIASARRASSEPEARRTGRTTRKQLYMVLPIALALDTTGCARVAPWERGRLAQPDMQMELDGDLRAGPEHAVEYREGSAGGLGGGGGGCGCN